MFSPAVASLLFFSRALSVIPLSSHSIRRVSQRITDRTADSFLIDVWIRKRGVELESNPIETLVPWKGETRMRKTRRDCTPFSQEVHLLS